MIAILVFCWLRESITKFELGAMCVCFGGIILVAMDHSQQEVEAEEGVEVAEEEENNKSAYLLGIFAALVTTLMYAITGVVSRRLKDLHYSVIQFHYALVGTLAFTVYNIIL